MRVLCILSDPRPEERSWGKRLAKTFVDEYCRVNPSHSLEVVDLYERGLGPLTYEALEDARTKGEGPMIEEAERFKGYDKYLVVSPEWNYYVPAILKSYVDHIVVSGITFKYTRFGMPMGLLKNKKAFYIGTRGEGNFPPSKDSLDVKYIKGIFRFMGVKSFGSLVLENNHLEEVEKEFLKSQEELKKYARSF